MNSFRILDLILIIIAILQPIFFFFLKYWLQQKIQSSVSHQYETKIEILKKDLSFELDKEKKLYSGKLAQYKKYYQILDRFNSDIRKKAITESFDLMQSIMKDPSEENFNNSMKRILDMIRDFNEPVIQLKNEISGLKLESGEELLVLLKEYELEFEEVVNKTSSIISTMPTYFQELLQNSHQDNTNQFMNNFKKELGGDNLLILQEKIFYQMRKELGIK